MNNNFQVQNGGVPIKPSARKSIHSHSDCLFSERNMVRYGLSERNRNEHDNKRRQNEGTDEVDHVMSKLKHPISPTYGKERRNSVTSPDYYDSSDGDERMLFSKSLPAYLPSYYSNESENCTQTNHQESNNSVYVTPERTRSNRSRHNESSDNLRNKSQGTPKSNRSNQQSIQNKSTTKVILSVLTVAVGTIIAFNMKFIKTQEAGTNVMYDKIQFYRDTETLADRYKVDSDSILRVQTGIATIFENEDTSSFIFAYNNRNSNFNGLKFNKFINEVAYAAAKYLRNNSTPVHYTVVNPTDLNMHTHSELINKYRDNVTNTGVMLVNEIDTVPSQLAMAFHYYCDDYDPLVKKSAIFFTLNVAKCSYISDQKTIHGHIEKCLSKIWNKVPQDNIRPLLTRVVNVVIDVTSVF